MTGRGRANINNLFEHTVGKLRSTGIALDIGAAKNLDYTRYLLKKGFSVETLDINPDLEKSVAQLQDSGVSAYIGNIEEIPLRKEYFDLILTIQIFHYLRKENLSTIFDKIVSSLKSGGIICGTFLGTKDTWAKTERAFLTREEANEMLKNLAVFDFSEMEFDGGAMWTKHDQKHWHLFTFAARKL